VLGVIDAHRGSLSMADGIVLAGSAAIEKAAKDAGHDVTVPFMGGRGDAGEEHTDAASFEPLEPFADGFRNYLKTKASVRTEEMLIDKAHLLGLSIPELTVLIGGLRVLGANSGNRKHGVFTDKVGVLTTDFFRNLLDMGTKWAPVDGSGDEEYVGTCRTTGAEKIPRHPRRSGVRIKRDAARSGRSLCRSRGRGQIRADFIAAWNKVMNADRFDVSYAQYH